MVNKHGLIHLTVSEMPDVFYFEEGWRSYESANNKVITFFSLSSVTGSTT